MMSTARTMATDNRRAENVTRRKISVKRESKDEHIVGKIRFSAQLVYQKLDQHAKQTGDDVQQATRGTNTSGKTCVKIKERPQNDWNFFRDHGTIRKNNCNFPC